jgi:hypothetical protein
MLNHSRRSHTRAPRACSARPKARLSLETLESRTLLSVTAPIDVSKATGAQSEVSIDIDPINSQHLVAASNDVAFGKPIKVSYSTNGGASWVTAPALSLSLNGTSYSYDSDPSVAFDTQGNVYVSTLMIKTTFFGLILKGDTLAVSKYRFTTSNGVESLTLQKTWAVQASPNSTNLFADHPWLAVDDNPQSPYHDTVYVTWSQFKNGDFNHTNSMVLSRLTPGATAWTAPVTISDAGHAEQFANPAVAPDGTVYVSWLGPPDATNRAVQYVDVSTNGGQSFGVDVPVTTIQTDGQDAFSLAAVPDRGAAAQEFIDTDRSGTNLNPGPHRGRVYLVYADRAAGTNTNDTDIFLQYSDDQGKTWSPRLQVNDAVAGLGTSQFFPSMSVDPSNGAVVISWYDTRNDPANAKTDIYLRSWDQARGFGAETQVTTVSSDESTANAKRDANNYGDYAGLVAAGGVAYPVWTGAVAADFAAGKNEEMYFRWVQYPLAPAPVSPASLTGSSTSSGTETGSTSTSPSTPLAARLTSFARAASVDHYFASLAEGGSAFRGLKVKPPAKEAWVAGLYDAPPELPPA